MRQFVDAAGREQQTVGVRSAKSARWMRKHLYGTIIPEEYVERLEGAANPAAEGERIAVELIEELAAVPGVAGVHIMAPVNDAAVPGVIAEARKRLAAAPGRVDRPAPSPAEPKDARGSIFPATLNTFLQSDGLPEANPAMTVGGAQQRKAGDALTLPPRRRHRSLRRREFFRR